MADEFKKEDILELEAEVDEDAINIPAEVPLTKNEALALIVYKMHQKGLVHHEKTEEEIEEERQQDELLNEFGL